MYGNTHRFFPGRGHVPFLLEPTRSKKIKLKAGIGSAWVGISGKFYSFGIPLLPQKHEIVLLSSVVATDARNRPCVLGLHLL